MYKRALGVAALAVSILAGCGNHGVRTVVAQAMAVAPGDEDNGLYGALAAVPDPQQDGDDKFPFQRHAAMPVPAGHQGVWLAFSNHNHSTYWDGVKPLTLMQAEASLANLDAMALTDHDTMRGTLSPEFQAPPQGLLMVKGMEWNAFREHDETVVGHAGLLGMDGTDPLPTGEGLDAMLDQAVARHATIIINHPFASSNSWSQPKPDPRAHAIEVWNGWWFRAQPLIHNDKALAWWDQSLRAGQHFTAVAGTDSHGHWYDSVARNVNMVFAQTPDQAGILAGIRAGHVSITSSPTSGRLFLEASSHADGTFDTMMGETIPHPADGKVMVRARVVGGKGKKVVFYTAKGKVTTAGVNSDDATIEVPVSVGPGQNYVRAELRAHPLFPMSMTAISNPIYVAN